MSKKVQRAYAKFSKLKSMNLEIDAGGDAAVGVEKQKRKLADSWTKRQSNNVTGFYDPKKARAKHA